MLLSCVLLPLVILGAAAAPTTDNDRNDNDHKDNDRNDNDHKDNNHAEYKYVALFSVDGMHGSDVEQYVALRPKSTIAQLLKIGYEYTDAFTSAPSDSFPGSLFQFTGASPKTTGVWYDDAYDRTYYAPFSQSGTHCVGPPGAEGIPKSGQFYFALLTKPSRV